jgi:zinc protease
LLLLVGVLLAALPARTGTLDAAQVTETVFPNGLRLIIKEAHATELAAVQVWVRAGGFLEDEKTSGTAHVIEHLVFKGSETRGPGMIDAEIENLGGLLEASTEKDWTRFSCTLNGRYVGKVIPVIADALKKPLFRPADFEAEKPVIIEEIGQAALTPEGIVSQSLYGLAFKSHPYKYDVRGTAQFLEKLKPEALRAYYQKYYVPSNMTVVVVGDVDRAGVERVTRTAFQGDQPAPPASPAGSGARRGSGPFTLPPDETACARSERRVLTTDFIGGYVGVAYPAPAVREEPDTYAMDLLLTMLENEATGRLPRQLKGLAAIQATYETRRQPGLFTIVAATGKDDAEQVEALIRKEVDFLSSHPVSEAELAIAKRMLRGSFALDNEPYAGQAATLGYYASIDRWQFASDYLSRVEAVTPEQVQAAAAKYLSPDHCVSVLLKPHGGPPPTRPPRVGT